MTKPKFTPWPKVSGRYGAPMGRMSAQLNPNTSTRELAVSGPAGEYDAGGAYWGTSDSEGPVWAVWVKGKGRDGVAYVRARSRGRAAIVAVPCTCSMCESDADFTYGGSPICKPCYLKFHAPT